MHRCDECRCDECDECRCDECDECRCDECTGVMNVAKETDAWITTLGVDSGDLSRLSVIT